MSAFSHKLVIKTYEVLGFLLTLAGMSYSHRRCMQFLRNARPGGYDVIIIPGAPWKPSGWDIIMKGRLIWAKYLYDSGIARNMIFSGAAVYTPYNEGAIMAAYAIAMGIPAEHVFAERKAEHGTENIYYSYRMSVNLGFKSVALATDPFQTKMLQKFTNEKVDPEIDLLPIVFRMVGKTEPNTAEPAIDSNSALEKNWISIKKRMGFWRRLKGTRGEDIDYTAY